MNDQTEDLHHELGPSGAHRWMNCTQSVIVSRGLPDTSSEYADEGTLAHSIAADVLRSTLKLPQHQWHKASNVRKSTAMKDLGDHNAEPLQRYVDYVLERVAECGATPFTMIETRLDLGKWIPGGFGTGDTIIYNAIRRALLVIDLKFGEGVMVYANERVGDGFQVNSQLGLYGLGAYDITSFLDVDEVELVIQQPRREHKSATMVSVPDLLAFGERVREAIVEINTNPKYRPGDKTCQWCKVRATCAARAQWAMELFGQEIGLMTPQQIAEALARVDGIKAWCTDLEEHAMRSLHSDRKAIPGWKLVAGRGSRTWNASAETVLQNHLGDKAWDRKLIGITAAEKLLGKEAKAVMPGITVKSDGKPTLAPDSDPRTALSDATDGFKVEASHLD